MRAKSSDGVGLHYEVTGQGEPIVFIHEFAGDHRSWRPQVAHFAPRWTCVTYAARGYPPSDVPAELAAYSQVRAVEDARAILDAASLETAHIVGISMGGFTALHLILRFPERVRSAVIAGVGYGAQPDRREQFRRESLAIAEAFELHGSARVAEGYALGPARVQLQSKNPEVWREFRDALAGHDARGAALTMRGVQAARPSLYDMVSQLGTIRTPVRIIVGDEDDGSLDPSLMLKRTVQTSSLAVLPSTGHTANLEEPDRFNELVERFIDSVEAGLWRPRDPRSFSTSITGMAVDKR